MSTTASGSPRPADQVDRQLDALARHDPRGLHDEGPRLPHAELRPHVTPHVRARRGAWVIEIEDVGNHGRPGAGPLLEACRGKRADADVTDEREDRGEGRLQDVGNDAMGEALALPPVVVVVADGGQAGLLDQAPGAPRPGAAASVWPTRSRRSAAGVARFRPRHRARAGAGRPGAGSRGPPPRHRCRGRRRRPSPARRADG